MRDEKTRRARTVRLSLAVSISILSHPGKLRAQWCERPDLVSAAELALGAEPILGLAAALARLPDFIGALGDLLGRRPLRGRSGCRGRGARRRAAGARRNGRLAN